LLGTFYDLTTYNQDFDFKEAARVGKQQQQQQQQQLKVRQHLLCPLKPRIGAVTASGQCKVRCID
jgi:hypothetical protein